MLQQYRAHARRNDEHYYGTEGATPCQNTLRRTEMLPIVFGRYGEWSDSARELIGVLSSGSGRGDQTPCADAVLLVPDGTRPGL